MFSVAGVAITPGTLAGGVAAILAALFAAALAAACAARRRGAKKARASVDPVEMSSLHAQVSYKGATSPEASWFLSTGQEGFVNGQRAMRTIGI